MASLLHVVRATVTNGAETPNYWYGMNPSTGASVVFVGLFGIGALYHAFQLVKYRAWYFTAFMVGAFMMTIGYIFRYISIKNSSNLGPFVMQTLFILLPPSLYAATIYMLYGRIVLLVNAAHLSLIRPTWVTKIFVAGDAFAFILQVGGGSMLTMDGKEDLGKKILLAGLFFQLLSFGFFLVVSAVFYYRVEKSRRVPVPNYGKYHWTTMMKVMYFGAALIILRCVFRVIEFTANEHSAVRKNEIYAYCFDAAPMLVVQSTFHIFHGGMVFPFRGAPAKSERLDEGGSLYELSRGSRV